VSKPLAGTHILVTRPPHQAGELAEKIRAAGGKPYLFPVLEIQDISDPRPLLELIERLDEFYLAIFVSPNAVNKAMSVICAKRALPPELKIATVGQGTAKTLQRFGVSGVIVPAARFDSEALLDMAELNPIKVAGKRVIIFRGDSGRELLGETLTKRGAFVEYAECYRRIRPKAEVAPLLAAWTRGEMNAVTVTSSEGLRNLWEMVGDAGRTWLESTPLFVSHERIAGTAQELGFKRVIATAAGDDGLVAGLQDYFSGRIG
jgi:uroporphyrinogen-III synthase